MSAENRLHFFRMCAWGMFDPDALPKRERKVRLNQIRHVLEDCGFTLHVGGSVREPWYTVLHGEVGVAGSTRGLHSICRKLLHIIDAKFPPKDANSTR